ncbi:MAG: SPOR domain-containing protein [Bacteroidales bacterium]
MLQLYIKQNTEKPLFKVIIGPFSTKEEANKGKTKLKPKFEDIILSSGSLH